MTWTAKQLKDLQAAGKIKGWKEVCTVSKAPAKKPYKASEKVPKALQFILQTLESAGIAYETEYVFASPRKFRFDIAIPARLVAIEYEGLMSKKSRHTTATGYTRDATKYNLAQSLGWKVYRYTALNYKDFENDLKGIL